MTIYEINKEIEELIATSIDEETGELILNTDRLEALQMERDAKIENLALAFKNLTAEAKAIKTEEENLAARRKSVEKAAERAKSYLEFVLNGETFKSAKAIVSYRRSESVQLDDEFIGWAKEHWAELLRQKEPEADKTAIKAQLKAGAQIEHAQLVTNTSMQIK